MKKAILVLIITSFIFCGISYAQPRGDHRGQECQQDVRQDIEKANNMVRHGIKTGQIDSREADRIRQNIRRVENDLNRFISDGRLNPRECERLQRETRDLYKHIRYEMNDGNVRRDYRGQECQQDVRQDIEKANNMVRHGIKTGQIDSREADRIRQNIRRVENDLNRFVSDGRLNPGECERLQRETRGLYKHIRYEMNDGNDRRDHRGEGCQQDIRQDLSRARVMVRDGVNSEKISPQELFVINKKIENLENDLNRSRSDGRLRPEECAGLKQKAKDLIDTIMYAATN